MVDLAGHPLDRHGDQPGPARTAWQVGVWTLNWKICRPSSEVSSGGPFSNSHAVDEIHQLGVAGVARGFW